MTASSYIEWNRVTADLPWGVQTVLKDTLELVESGDVQLVWGADYSGNHACLINSVAQMLTTGGGYGIPMAHFGPLVSLFDRINRDLKVQGVNKNNYVSPLAAEVLLRYFAPIKPQPEDAKADTVEAMEHLATEFELSDEDAEYAKEWLNSVTVEHAQADFNASSASS